MSMIPAKMTPTRAEYIERARQRDCEKSRSSYARKKERERAAAERIATKPVRQFSRPHDTHSPGVYYAKEPEQTQTDIGGYGVVLGCGKEMGGTQHKGLPVKTSRPEHMLDGRGERVDRPRNLVGL